MKFITGYSFKVAKPKMSFKVGETYRIYHISKLDERVEYIFQSNSGHLKETFDSPEHADAIIEKISGK